MNDFCQESLEMISGYTLWISCPSDLSLHFDSCVPWKEDVLLSCHQSFLLFFEATSSSGCFEGLLYSHSFQEFFVKLDKVLLFKVICYIIALTTYCYTRLKRIICILAVNVT